MDIKDAREIAQPDEPEDESGPVHIIPVSGGADSGALAAHLVFSNPGTKYRLVFTDTGAELPECYEFIDRLENHLGVPILRLFHRLKGDDTDYDLEKLIARWGGFIPSRMMRWCTKHLKIRPFETYLRQFKGRKKYVYIGFTADEAKLRKGHIVSDKEVEHRFPLAEQDINDSKALLRSYGLEPPAYYSWRTRSGCYCCFFQRKAEWQGLLKNHPDLFARARELEENQPDYKKPDGTLRRTFYWRGDQPLAKLQAEYEHAQATNRLFKIDPPDPDDIDEEDCAICSI